MFFFRLILSLYLFLSINIFANNDFVVAVSKESKVEVLTKNEIAKLFLSKIKSFPNGEKAITIEINNKESQINFYKKLTNKNEKQLLKYWAKMIFTGRGIPPKKLEKESELIEFVTKNKNAITYIKRKDLNKDLKIVWEGI